MTWQHARVLAGKGSQHPALTNAVSDGFPDTEVVLLYIKPATSNIDQIWSLGLNQCLPDIVQNNMPLQASLFVGHRFNTTVFQAVLMEQFQ
jgi:hypothetical protein